MDDLFERHPWEDSAKGKAGIFYFQSEKELPKMLLSEIEELDQEQMMVDIAGYIENKKWKSYLNKDHFVVLNDDEKLVWSNGSETHTGSWEYMKHSSLLLFNFIQPEKVHHLVYHVLHCSEELLVLKPQHANKESSAYYEVYYCGRKPSQSKMKELLIDQGGPENKDWLIYLSAAILLFLLVLYFLIIY